MRTFVCLFCVLIPLATSAQEPDPFARQKAAFAAKLKNKAPAVRLDAVRKMAEFPGPDAAQLLWQFALKDADADVRWAAYDTLLSYRSSREATLAMLEQIEIGLTQTRQEATAAWLLGPALAADDAGLRKQLDAALAKAAERSAVRVAILLSETLASRATVDEVLPLSRLAKTQLSARVFGVRRAAVQGLLAIPHRDAVAALVDLLPNLRGEVRADALLHLQAVTGRKPADDAGWSAWWQEGGPQFEYPRQGTYQPGQRTPEALGQEQNYYGQPLFAERLVFVIDTSDSMAGPRIIAARRELLKAIAQLPESTSFSIVVYNDASAVWRKMLVPATPANVADATDFVRRLATQGKTNAYDALSTALRFDAEALYFLSDGEPTTGSLIEPGPIITAVCEQNRLKRMSLYTIGIQPGPRGNKLDTFLAQLAAKNLGAYRRVEE